MIFNSLGSNYSFGFVIKSLFCFFKKNNAIQLKQQLEKKYGGDSILLYKGREAIKLALEISGLPKGSKVGVNGFTCYVVNQAVTEAGYVPIYLDIGDWDLNFDFKNLEKNKDIKVLIIQNTLGCPVDIISVKSFCNKNKVLMIEDLAHSAGGHYLDGSEIGCAGDFTALSFSQDKIIDAVSGGALIVRNNKYRGKLNEIEILNIPGVVQFRDTLYPLLTFVIRKLYPFVIGKVLHYFVKKFKLLSDPMGVISKIEYHALPGWHASMALSSLQNLSRRIRHRRKISMIYINNLNENILSSGVIKNCDLSTNIRFPVFVENRAGLVRYLKNHDIFVSDIWYDAPVAPLKLINRTGYEKGDCLKAEVDAEQILNLPTHINVSEKEAERVCSLINKWQNTNQK
jgi:dTDP-4-amino-4,6-dideoxygalactose transaminase